MFQVVNNQEREDGIRQVALENIVTIAETMPGLTRKQSDLIPHISKSLLCLDQRDILLDLIYSEKLEVMRTYAKLSVDTHL